MGNYRFAAHVLMFNVTPFIVRMIDNCGPFVEKIYVLYSELPYSVNKKARSLYKNPTGKEILNGSKYPEKIKLIEGVWGRENDARNTALQLARSEDFDYLIIQDADEFYSEKDYKDNIETITRNSNSDFYTTPERVFWKSLDFVLENGGRTLLHDITFAVNCGSDTSFYSGRGVASDKKRRLPGICHHLSYVLTDEQLKLKINTWHHANDFNRESWYRRKWLRWTENTKNLHPTFPPGWKRAVKFTGQLPRELRDFVSPPIIIVKSGVFHQIWDAILDSKFLFIYTLKRMKKYVKGYLADHFFNPQKLR